MFDQLQTMLCWFGLWAILFIILCIITKVIMLIINKIEDTHRLKLNSNFLIAYFVISMLPSAFIGIILNTAFFYDDAKYIAENTQNITLCSIDAEQYEDIYLINVDNNVFVYNDGKERKSLNLNENSKVIIENSEENTLIITEYEYHNEWYEFSYNPKTVYKFLINDEYILS